MACPSGAGSTPMAPMDEAASIPIEDCVPGHRPRVQGRPMRDHGRFSVFGRHLVLTADIDATHGAGSGLLARSDGTAIGLRSTNIHRRIQGRSRPRPARRAKPRPHMAKWLKFGG